MLLLLLACPKSSNQRGDALELAVERVDAAWVARDQDGLPAVATALEEAQALAPTSPAVIWRTVRYDHAHALTLAEPTERRRALARARSTGWSCVLADPAVYALRQESTLDEALAGLDEQRRPCATWGALAWSRWSLAFGIEASALDRPRIRALLAVPSDDHTNVQRWAHALYDTLEGRRGEAQQAFADVITSGTDPSGGLTLVDRFRYANVGTEPTLSELTSPEARAVLKRILDLDASDRH